MNSYLHSKALFCGELWRKQNITPSQVILQVQTATRSKLETRIQLKCCVFLIPVVPYRVLIYPSLKFGCTTTSANPWITFAGHMGETGVIEIPKGVLEFSVEVMILFYSII